MASRPGAEGSLPPGATNEFLIAPPQDIEIYSHHPDTVYEHGRHAASSMQAIAQMEHIAFPTDLSADQTERRFWVDPKEQAATEMERETIKHRPGDPRYIPLNHLPGVKAASYVEGVGRDDGVRYAAVKIQPVVTIPDIADPNLSEEQQMELFRTYRQALAFPTELIWESQNPGTVTVQRGREAVPVTDLPINQLITATGFLRRMAMWDMLTRANDESQPDHVRQAALTLLDKLQPITDNRFNEGRQLGRPQ